MVTKKKKLILEVGEEFSSIEIDAGGDAKQVSAEAINAVTNAHESKTRTYISYICVGMIILFLLGSAGLGLLAGNFVALGAVWGVVGPLTGAIFGYYYKPGG